MDYTILEHTAIEEQNLVERYLLGSLTASERERFEAHFVDCPRCLDQLEGTESFQAALKAVAAEEAARTVARGGVLAFLSRRSGWRVVLGLLAVLAPAALTLAVVLPLLESAEHQRVLAERTARQDRHRLEQVEREASELGERLAALRRPEVNTPSILLGAFVRGGAEDVVRLKTTERQRVVLEVDAMAPFESYRGVLADAAGRPIWQERLWPSPWALLEVTFPAGFLEPGEYRLDFAGLDAEGRSVEVGSFRLLAEP